MMQYLDYLRDIVDNGAHKTNRTGVDTLAVFGRQLRFDLDLEGFPAVTTKKLYYKTMVTELCWMLRGGDNVRWLQDHGCRIWDEWADNRGDLGPVYGSQWRRWPVPRASGETGYFDQIEQLEAKLKYQRDDRRMIVSAWNVAQLPSMALPPCHLMFQCYVEGEYLDLQMYQRSVDSFFGLPFNIASYATLLSLLARRAGLRPRELVWVGGDCHLYENTLPQVQEQLTRPPYGLPQLIIEDDALTCPLDKLEPDMFGLVGYRHHEPLKGAIAV